MRRGAHGNLNGLNNLFESYGIYLSETIIPFFVVKKRQLIRGISVTRCDDSLQYFL